MSKLSLLPRRVTRLAAVGSAALFLGLSLPMSQALWIKVLRVGGTIQMRAAEARVFKGCSFVFWMDPASFGLWPDPYEPETTFESVFGRDVPGDPTLLDALALGGDGLEALMRQAVAALLNATSPDLDYPFPPQAVVNKVQASIDFGRYDLATEAFAGANEAGCPLAAAPTETPAASPTETPTATGTMEATPTDAPTSTPTGTVTETATVTATPPEATATAEATTDQSPGGSAP